MKLTAWGSTTIAPTMRVISDNDFSGDPDGLIQLAHHLLSPSVEMRGVISSHLRDDDHWNRTGDSVSAGITAIEELLQVMKIQFKLLTIKLNFLLTSSSRDLSNFSNKNSLVSLFEIISARSILETYS